MEEKKVADVVSFPVSAVNFPVKKTESIESFSAFPPRDFKEIFDGMYIKEIREICLNSINPDFDSVDWLIDRVKAYCRINDYETVCILLRVLCRHQFSQSQRIADLMVDSIRFGMNSAYARNNIKDMLVILCGRLQYANDLYNENVRKLFQEIIEKIYEGSVYGSAEERFRLISRVLFIIAAVKDESFIPILERMNINKKELEHLMKYVSISKERISFEGLRMIVLRHLKS